MHYLLFYDLAPDYPLRDRGAAHGRLQRGRGGDRPPGGPRRNPTDHAIDFGLRAQARALRKHGGKFGSNL